MSLRQRLALVALGGLLLSFGVGVSPPEARAEAETRPVSLGGYFRVMARPDFQGGVGSLGYWNLYGRLLNEGPWGMLELRVRLLDSRPGAPEPWTALQVRIEGGGVANAEKSGGLLGNFRLSQLYVEAGNILLPNVTWRIGTQETWFGDLGLYDMRPTTLFYETLGLSGRWSHGPGELMVGLGDSGFGLRGFEYSPVLTFGLPGRVRAAKHFELGLGGQLNWEPQVEGNRFAPHSTPGVGYEDWLRGEVVERFLADNPGQEEAFPDPVPRQSFGGKAVGYLGFGNLGPLRWNAVHVSFAHLQPDNFTTEDLDGEEFTIYTTELTDRRFVLTVGNEAQFTLLPDRLDLVWGLLYGDHWDEDNELAPSDHDRSYFSTVLRLQAYLVPTVHLLVEGSFAIEQSRNGNSWRNHGDSIFVSTGGLADADGLEYGDADERRTGQVKAGFVLNPTGPGIYTRPSLRILYGLQYSTQNQAYGNSFVESLSQFNEFGSWESHWHHVLALEAEAWF
ncbi:MAG: hypothetical protein VX498_05590 [Myxococcota bacterium]|nr:hypothetical protein [Myxococcota bacterium]